eukprot:CAMPEP_0194374702 /NCGR_PEP_ID=MMETSP0174-20130528/23149_1 /TAXON_ID=216777 /ORGANISM="Proboscia alata, Strain PI-D3" /LENGTH=507 /DNA_ID=CAMNT_0039154437 /DNA_START=57 /DNA_END=1580 /DNA_ORIENTATION=+
MFNFINFSVPLAVTSVFCLYYADAQGGFGISVLPSCTLCPGGENPLNTDLLHPIDGTTCGEVASLMETIDDETACAPLQSKYAYICGCLDVVPSCTLCANDANPLNPDFEPQYGGGLTCNDMVITVPNTEAGEACEATQSFFGPDCGCPRDTDGASDFGIGTFEPPSCTLCPGGQSPPYLDLVHPIDGITCAEMADFMTSIDDDNEVACAATQAKYAYSCGCPDVVPSCTLCANDSTPLNPDVEPEFGGGLSCEDLVITGLNVEAGEACEQFQSLFRPDCGCPDDDVPGTGAQFFPTCTLCPGGEDVPFPDLMFGTESCEELNLSGAYFTGVDCIGHQDFFAKMCKCPSASDVGGLCPLCPNGADFNFEKRPVGESEPTCGELADIVQYQSNKEKCAEMQEIGVEVCECGSQSPSYAPTALRTLLPTVKPSHTPTAKPSHTPTARKITESPVMAESKPEDIPSESPVPKTVESIDTLNADKQISSTPIVLNTILTLMAAFLVSAILS